MATAQGSTASALRGVIERVVFHDEETGYCVLKVLPEGLSEVVHLVGKAARVVAGETIEAFGSWVTTREHGKQFKALQIKLTRPDTLDGIIRYLSSGLIEGIGPTYAKKLVSKFGNKLFNTIENESVKLEQVEGIGKKRRQEIRDSWMRQKNLHEIMLFLHQYGVGSARALRIYKTYGQEAIEVLKRDPYRLARDIHGIGFHSADTMAFEMGLTADSPERLQAGLLHVVEQAAAQQGHTCLPEDLAIEKAVEILQTLPADRSQAAVGNSLPYETVLAPVLEALIRTKRLYREMIHEQSRLFLPHLRTAELSILQHLEILKHECPDYPEISLETEVKLLEERKGIQLAPSQFAALQRALTYRAFILTGGPGVGKTTLLGTLIQIFDKMGMKIVLAAPTGRAANRLSESAGKEAMTLHRLLEYQGHLQWGRHAGRKLEGQVFIVDECSMIDTSLMAQFLSALPRDAHLILVGDADQLPSVGPGQVFRDLLSSQRLPVIVLTELFRQAATSHIVTNAHAVNRGQVPDLKTSSQSDFFFLKADSAEETAEMIVQLVKTRLPTRYGWDPQKEIQVLSPMNRGELGTLSLNQRLQSALNPPSELKFELDRFGSTFRVGDKVLQNQNNYDKDVYNGDLGYIAAIDADPVRIWVRFDSDRLVSYEPGELDELQLAYAMTIHKSQGAEFPCVIVPLTPQHFVLLERSLLYTAITRAKKLVVLVGSQRALELAVRQQGSRKRFTGLA